MTEYDMPSYPGLNYVSTVLWREWLKLYESKFQGFEYNVRIGQGIQPPAGASEADAAVWKALTQKRIDVVASRPGQTWIIEIEERPGARTFGQLGLYEHMAPKYISVQPVMVGALVCRYLGFDMFSAFHTRGDMIFKFAPGKPPSLPPSFLPAEAGVEFTPISMSYRQTPP